jgi:hypothetical protein
LQAKSVFQLARVSAIGGWLARILSAGVDAPLEPITISLRAWARMRRGARPR